jgi:hypothetical protein
MKKTIISLFGNPTALAVGVFMVLSPAAVTARESGHGGGGSVSRGAAVGRFNGGGGHTSVGVQRGYFAGGERIGVRGIARGFGGRYYGGAYLGIGAAPYGYGYYPGYAYGPGYAVAPAPQPCGPAAYDAYGNPVQNPACYSGQQPYAQPQYNASPQQQVPAQQQYPAQQEYGPAQPYPQQQQYYGQPQQYGR